MDAEEVLNATEEIARQRHVVNEAAERWKQLEKELGTTHPDTIAAADETAYQRGLWGDMRRRFSGPDIPGHPAS